MESHPTRDVTSYQIGPLGASLFEIFYDRIVARRLSFMRRKAKMLYLEDVFAHETQRWRLPRPRIRTIDAPNRLCTQILAQPARPDIDRFRSILSVRDQPDVGAELSIPSDVQPIFYRGGEKTRRFAGVCERRLADRPVQSLESWRV